MTEERNTVPIYEYTINAVTAVNFKLVFTEEDLKRRNEKCEFKPEMAHQVFGDGEKIFGYRGLSIDLYYLHNSSNCFMDMRFMDKINNLEADEVADLMNPWLPTGYVSKIEEFRKIIRNEKHDQIFGTIIHQFERSTEVNTLPGNAVTCQYKITQCDLNDQLFQDYHQRFETYIIWFIDAANFIDLNDDRWLIFYVYEEFKHPETDEIFVTPIGYTAIYKFFSYPSSNRARISQFFILPTHQRKGIGSELYKVVYNRLLNDMADVVDITVEEPSDSFQKMRDICDSFHIYKDLQASNTNIASKSPKILFKYMAKHKICKRQALRLSDILQYYNALKSGNGEVKSFMDSLLKRMKIQLERDFGIHKRARGLLPEETQEPGFLMEENLKARFSNYLSEIKPVAEKLKLTLN